MGIIMAVGVAIANAILYITNAQELRKNKANSFHQMAAKNRIRPIMMTSAAMIAGMIPMAIGLGEGGDQTAPLGIAVIGGLLFSLISTLFFLPMMYHLATNKQTLSNASLDPNDINSNYYDIQ
jgi:multidrug efflux pump subunit AcrB